MWRGPQEGTDSALNRCGKFKEEEGARGHAPDSTQFQLSVLVFLLCLPIAPIGMTTSAVALRSSVKWGR